MDLEDITIEEISLAMTDYYAMIEEINQYELQQDYLAQLELLLGE